MEKKCINEELIINHFVRQIKIGKVWVYIWRALTMICLNISIEWVCRKVIHEYLVFKCLWCKDCSVEEENQAIMY